MRMSRTTTVYVLLLAVWVIIAAWQLLEHKRATQSAREALVNRARDISYSLAAVIRSQGRFFGMVSRPRLEAALEDLAKSNEVRAVSLLNSAGQVVASAGEAIDLDIKDISQRGQVWNKDSVTFINLIDLGRAEGEGETSRPATIILPSDRSGRPSFSRGRRGPPRPTRQSINKTSDAVVVRLEFPPDTPTSGPGAIPRPRKSREQGPPPPEPLRVSIDRTSHATVMILEFPPDTPTTGPGSVAWIARDREAGRRPRRPRWPFGRPFGMDEKRYRELLQKQGLHGFVLTMSTERFRAENTRDLGLRLIMGCVALVAVIGLGLAWRALERSARLQLRLVRASEMNAYLREMNVAAAGLAHETRNPLNLVRGLAQLISQQEDTAPEVRERSREIVEEVDRVTGRLNEFIDYSRPREAKPAPIDFQAVVRDVERALESDREDKDVEFRLEGPQLTVEADESLLRQVLFNLLLNSIQAVEPGGKVEVVVEKRGAGEASFEVRDDGPGVPEEAREEIFRPYYTTHEAGSGLGLAVVRQIVQAHQWEIEYVPNQTRGACFRVSGLKVTSKAS